MSDKKPGLPASFRIEVESPVDLGDYLDEGFGNERVTDEAELVESSLPENSSAPLASEVGATEEVAPQPARRNGEVPTPKREAEPPRKQINMRPETYKKAEELLAIIQVRGPQRDAAASEMFDAMISALYQAKDRLDLSGVPKRGRWGTPTASAFIESLSRAFSEAISSKG